MEKRPRDRAWADYSEAFRKQVVPSLVKSAFMIHLGEGVPKKITNDTIQAATELGLILIMNKPLLVIVPKGFQIPDALRRAATIVLDDIDMESEADQDVIADAVRNLARELRHD
jgi:hypothetical protein